MAGRQRLVAVVVIALLAILLVVVLAVAGGGSDDEGGRLRAEVSALPRPGGEVIVYVEPTDNKADRASGRRRVTLRCRDRRDRIVVEGEHAWPFEDTDGGVFDPHAHQPLERGRRQIVRCELVGTGLEGPAKAQEL